MSNRCSNAVKTAGAFAIIAVPSFASAAEERATAVSIMEQNYPAEALAKGQQGVVAFAVDLDAAAKIDSCVVTKSSGYPLLDEATCDVIVKHAAFSPAESGGTRVATTRTGQMRWKLPAPYQGNARLAGPPVFPTSEQLEAKRLICSKSGTVGSLIRTTTYCLTRAQWAEGRYMQQAEAAKMNGYQQNHGCHLGAGTRC